MEKVLILEIFIGLILIAIAVGLSMKEANFISKMTDISESLRHDSVEYELALYNHLAEYIELNGYTLTRIGDNYYKVMDGNVEITEGLLTAVLYHLSLRD